MREETGGSLGLDGFWPSQENSAPKEEAESGRMTHLRSSLGLYTCTHPHRDTQKYINNLLKYKQNNQQDRWYFPFGRTFSEPTTTTSTYLKC